MENLLMKEWDKQCFGEFMSDRYRLMAFIRGMVQDPHVAEDIFQEVWLKLDDALRKGVTIRHTSAWCRGVAKNLILHHWRDCRNAKVVPDNELLSLVASAFEEQDTYRDYWRVRESALRECIDKLPERSKHILTLRYETGLPISRVAEQLGNTVTSVTKLLSRLRYKLRECVAKTLRAQGISP